ncbi:LysR substrate-binding domain-containing protein [Eoetvoesia caeni]|nr:LysR substrate-binding domain-containing protein [Eoetvoesiella caeni]
MSILESSAPRIQVDSTDLNDQTALAMAQGEIDIAIGYAAELNTGFYQQRLFTEHYACIARKQHPRLANDSSLSTARLLKEEYLSLVAPGTGHSLLDKHLHAEGITRSIKTRVSSFLGLEQIIVATDLLAIVPARLANTLAQGGRIRAFEIPFPMPAYEVRQYWHERYHHDPANRWLRQIIFNTFIDLPPVESAVEDTGTQINRN